jgi:beta-1,2-xylosyltransferase
MFRMEDLQAYMMRLFLEYARLVADEGEDMVCLSPFHEGLD